MSNVVKEKRVKGTFQQDGKKCVSLAVKRAHSEGDGLGITHRKLQRCLWIMADVSYLNDPVPQKTVVQCVPHIQIVNLVSWSNSQADYWTSYRYTKIKEFC